MVGGTRRNGRACTHMCQTISWSAHVDSPRFSPLSPLSNPLCRPVNVILLAVDSDRQGRNQVHKTGVSSWLHTHKLLHRHSLPFLHYLSIHHPQIYLLRTWQQNALLYSMDSSLIFHAFSRFQKVFLQGDNYFFLNYRIRSKVEDMRKSR